MRYKYCPECGNALIDKKAGDDGNVPYCTKCERFWFAKKELLLHGFIGYAKRNEFVLSEEVEKAFRIRYNNAKKRRRYLCKKWF